MPRQVGTTAVQGGGGGGGIFKLLASAIQPFVPAPVGAAAGFLAGTTGAGGVTQAVADMIGGEPEDGKEEGDDQLETSSLAQTQTQGAAAAATPNPDAPPEISPQPPMVNNDQQQYTPEQLQAQDEVFKLAEAQFPWLPGAIQQNPGYADGLANFSLAAKQRYGGRQA